MKWLKRKSGILFELGINALEFAVSMGFVSAAVLVVALGKFLLGGVLAAIAFGIFLRFKRRKQQIKHADKS